MGGEDDKKQKPDFKDVESGPMDENNRECRDVFCCLLFLANIAAMVYCTIHAYLNGNPDKIYKSVGINDTICGQDATANYPYIYFYNPLEGLSSRYCMKQCPYFDANNSLVLTECYNHGVGPGCASYTVTLMQNGSWAAGSPPSPYNNIYIGYETTPAFNRICLPTVAVLSQGLKDVANNISTALQQGSFASLTSDVKNNWMWLLAAVGFAVVVSLIFMFLLRCLVGLIVWFSIIGAILGFAGIGVLFCYNAGIGIFKDNLGFLGLPRIDGYISNTQYYATYGYICFGVSGFLLLMMICCCNRIRLAVAVCKVAGQFIVRCCQVMFVPIILAIILIGMWGACLLCIIYLLSSTYFYVAASGDMFTSVQDYAEPSLLRLYYFIFGTLWSSALIQAIGTFTIASTVCMWYYNHGANAELDSPVSRSARMAFRYHFGSLAFGSFILAVVQFLQMVVQLAKKQAEQSGMDQNKCFEYAINCLRCCLACVERIVQFINDTAYIQIALRGKNFCMAAFDGFQIVLSNGIRYLVVAGVGKLMMFLGRILIAVGTTAAFYCLITFVTTIKAGIIEPLYLLAVLICLFSDRLHHRLPHRRTLHVGVQLGCRHHSGLLHRRRDEPGSQGIQGALRAQRAQRASAQRMINNKLYLLLSIQLKSTEYIIMIEQSIDSDVPLQKMKKQIDLKFKKIFKILDIYQQQDNQMNSSQNNNIRRLKTQPQQRQQIIQKQDCNSTIFTNNQAPSQKKHHSKTLSFTFSNKSTKQKGINKTFTSRDTLPKNKLKNQTSEVSVKIKRNRSPVKKDLDKIDINLKLQKTLLKKVQQNLIKKIPEKTVLIQRPSQLRVNISQQTMNNIVKEQNIYFQKQRGQTSDSYIRRQRLLDRIYKGFQIVNNKKI